jgi:hypothetical protein
LRDARRAHGDDVRDGHGDRDKSASDERLMFTLSA